MILLFQSHRKKSETGMIIRRAMAGHAHTLNLLMISRWNEEINEALATVAKNSPPLIVSTLLMSSLIALGRREQFISATLLARNLQPVVAALTKQKGKPKKSSLTSLVPFVTHPQHLWLKILLSLPRFSQLTSAISESRKLDKACKELTRFSFFRTKANHNWRAQLR